jgi:hypothetical protein
MNAAAILILAALVLNCAELKNPGQGDSPLIAHEWGTFTSVAGEDGNPVTWAPLFGAPDLPCFVSRFAPGALTKWQISGLIRMETPVLYFYSQRPTTLSVRVDFPKGLITEWYPPASKVAPSPSAAVGPVYRNGSVEWDEVSVLPGAPLDYPSTSGASRYYAARQTDSAPLRIGGQKEKFIFYRGVGSFTPSLRPRYRRDGKIEIRNAAADPIPLAILFENHGGRVGLQTVRGIEDSATLDPPALTGDLERFRKQLAASLVEFGLYPKEASAMVETWRDSWFEEGTRVLYIAPRQDVDLLLPLRVTPAPGETARVFVGRIEVLSTATRETLQDAAGHGDSQTLEKFGRFLGLFARRMELSGPALQNAMAALARNTASCIQ